MVEHVIIPSVATERMTSLITDAEWNTVDDALGDARPTRPVSVTIGLLVSGAMAIICGGMFLYGLLELACATKDEPNLGFLMIGAALPLTIGVGTFCLTYGQWINRFPPYGDNYYDGI